MNKPEDQAMLDRMNARLNARKAEQDSGERERPKPAPQASRPTEQAEEPVQSEAEKPPEIQRAEYAFLVIKNVDGSFAITPNLNMAVVSARVPTNDDVWQAFQNILKDLQTQQTAQICGQVAAQAAVQMFQQLTQQMVQGNGAGAGAVDNVLQNLAKERQVGPRG